MEKVIDVQSRFVRKVSDLRVYQEAFSISLEVHKETLNFPRMEQYALGDQMRRASKSICANLVEAFARQSAYEAEFKRFLTIAISSSDEMQLWVQYAVTLEYIRLEIAEKWVDRYDHISRMLQKLRG